MRSSAPSESCFRILMLISDTGGGHRASAEALADAFHYLYPSVFSISIVDMWTDFGVWPLNVLAGAYRYLCNRPSYWKLVYNVSQTPFNRDLISESSYLLCNSNFRKLVKETDPHIICSLHPLCQDIPLKIIQDIPRKIMRSSDLACLKRLEKDCQREAIMKSSLPQHQFCQNDPEKQVKRATLKRSRTCRYTYSPGKVSRPIFVTVVTDLAEAHPLWFHPSVDKCYVASEFLKKKALRNKLKEEQVEVFGLPLRRSFWNSNFQSKATVRQLINLPIHSRTCLIVGGGDGVGNLKTLAMEVLAGLRKKVGIPFTVVIVCGNNQELKTSLDNFFHSKKQLQRSYEQQTEETPKRKLEPPSKPFGYPGRSNSCPDSLLCYPKRKPRSFTYALSTSSHTHGKSEEGRRSLSQPNFFLDKLLPAYRVHSRFSKDFQVYSAASFLEKRHPRESDFGSLKNKSDGGSSYTWGNVSVRVLSFINNMDKYMAAADLLISKAGPGTIAEACSKALPVVLYYYLPGQEEGNMEFVTKMNFGLYCGNAQKLAEIVANLLTKPRMLAKLSRNALKALNLNGSLLISRNIVDLLLKRAEEYN